MEETKATIKRFGGPEPLATALSELRGRRISARGVEKWCERGIPAKWYLALQDLGAKQGVPVDLSRLDLEGQSHACEAV